MFQLTLCLLSLPGKPSAFVQCGQWVYPLAAGKSPVLKSAPTTYMFPELGRNGKRLSTTSSLHLCLALVTTRGTAQHEHLFLLMEKCCLFL